MKGATGDHRADCTLRIPAAVCCVTQIRSENSFNVLCMKFTKIRRTSEGKAFLASFKLHAVRTP